MAGYDIGSADRHRQLAAVIGKVTGQLAVGLTHGISFQRSNLFSGSGRSRLIRFSRFFLAGSRFTACFLCGTFAGFLYFFGNQAVDTRIKLAGLAPLLGNLVL